VFENTPEDKVHPSEHYRPGKEEGIKRGQKKGKVYLNEQALSKPTDSQQRKQTSTKPLFLRREKIE